MLKLKEAVIKVILWTFLIVCIFNALLLAFGYRDFSWELVAMALLSIVGLPLNVHFLFKSYNQRQSAWYPPATDEGNLINHYGYPEQLVDGKKHTEEEEDGLDLEGRFCINP